MILVVLYVLYSQYIYHTSYNTRKVGVIGHSYLEIIAYPI
jgi:hypothetical protein